MPLKVTFELSDADLRHFRQVMRTARAAAKTTSEKQIIGGAHKLLESVRASNIPDFVRERLLSVDTMIAMLEDPEWAITGDNRARVLSALAYFNEPVDLIPDHIPGFGFLDDAVMVQLVAEELKPDFDAYADFCEYRRNIDKGRRKKERPPERQASLEARRKQLHDRMRRRRLRRSRAHTRTTRKRAPFSLW